MSLAAGGSAVQPAYRRLQPGHLRQDLAELILLAQHQPGQLR